MDVFANGYVTPLAEVSLEEAFWIDAVVVGVD
jgi:hypothetical protein